MTVTRRGEDTLGAFLGALIGTPCQLCYRCRYEVERRMNADRSIGVAGAGSIGCFVGGMLAATGRRVALLARPRLIGEIRTHGLRLTNFGGSEQTISAD